MKTRRANLHYSLGSFAVNRGAIGILKRPYVPELLHHVAQPFAGRIVLMVALAFFQLSCSHQKSEDNEASKAIQPSPQHYRAVPAATSQVTFANRIRETANFNYFLYPFIYFGGGVATGDINNDGLPDIYLTSNMGLNALYLNRGNLTFEDISESAGVAGVFNRWTTGVTMVDINRDGYLDIYVSVAGPSEAHRGNLLYVNQQDNTFAEQAEQWGIADGGHAIQSAFFDYDRDGDLDLRRQDRDEHRDPQVPGLDGGQRDHPAPEEEVELLRPGERSADHVAPEHLGQRKPRDDQQEAGEHRVQSATRHPSGSFQAHRSPSPGRLSRRAAWRRCGRCIPARPRSAR